MIIGTVIPNNYFAPWESVKSFLIAATKYPITYAQGPYIYQNRNQLLKYAKKHEDSMLMIDSDIVFTLKDIYRINELLLELDTVTGVYCLGIEPYPAAILKRTEGDYEFTDPPKELAEIDACGAGFLGISKKIIKEIPEDSFNDVWEGKVKHGEDISFCHRLKEKGFKLWCDPSIKLGQARTKIIYPKEHEEVNKSMLV